MLLSLSRRDFLALRMTFLKRSLESEQISVCELDIFAHQGLSHISMILIFISRLKNCFACAARSMLDVYG